MVAAPLFLGGCSVDTGKMSASLAAKNGWTKPQSDCYADKLADIMDGEAYNYLASLLEKGADFKEATNMVRRRTGKSYAGAIKKDVALQSCIGG